MNFAVLQFPASNCDQDALHVLKDVLGQSARFIWHKENSLAGVDAVIIPGGFSYGDYLRTGAIARFSPIMEAVRTFAANGGPVLGICNGFQILCEAGLLPGALIRNRSLQFRCEHVFLKTGNNDSPFTNKIPPGQNPARADRPWRRLLFRGRSHAGKTQEQRPNPLAIRGHERRIDRGGTIPTDRSGTSPALAMRPATWRA